MLTINATDVRKEWSAVADTVIRDKPAFIKRTRDYMALINLPMLESVLAAYHFTANKFVEEDGSITLSLNEIDLIENARTEVEAKKAMADSIIEYAEEYYNDFSTWSIAPNRKAHIPYVLRALTISDPKKLGELIQCQDGKS